MTNTLEAKYIITMSFENELKNILNYWSKTIDLEHGGFYGKINESDEVIPGAVKGSVLNARILWTFSAAYNLTKSPEYLQLAERSLNYIKKYFVDYQYGGVFWSVNQDGSQANTKKQVYAIAFTIYGLSEYFKASGDNNALELAKSLFNDIEKHSFDNKCGGYLEAFTRNWDVIKDLRLSDKDANEKKTMNTHLHILEAYTSLYTIWPDKQLADKLTQLIRVFNNYIIDGKSFHLNLFFDENWVSKSEIVSYGHDIEASWLLLEAAEVLGDVDIINEVKEVSVKIALASMEGLDNGGMNYEFDPKKKHLIAEKHWWVQAEAMVGFLNAWQISGEKHFYDKFLAVWGFIQEHIIDHENGEWIWGILGDGTVMPDQDKAGFWKCPYHNSRACIEVIKRLG